MDIVQVPQIRSLHVQSNIRYRYAHTVVCSEVLNTADSAQEVTFSITLPESAFISSFSIEVDEKIYDAEVKEKEQAKEEYTQAVRRGRTAAHVAVNPRESNRFSVSVNAEAQKKIKFTLTYEELLNRKLGTYKHFINLEPGQIVDDFSVQINIEESTDITTLSVPAFNTDADAVNTLATILRPTPHSAVVKFAPTPDQQRKLSNDGIKGQLVVLYDVDRSSFPSEILVNDGYFAHFFAPDHLKPLPKYVMFVLDVSGSMSGRKIEQLKEAMESILSELRPQDYFTLLIFMNTVQVWRLVGDGEFSSASIQETDWKSLLIPATLDNIIRAKLAIHKLRAGGGTNIYTAFMTATHIAQLRLKLQQANSVALEPLIIFLTDGQPTVGETGKDEIINETTRWNQMGKAAIFSLGLGRDVDYDFLKKLSLRNSGFARKIYEASDTALQLTNFYKQVSSPLLSSITFIYQPEQVEPTSVTRNQFVTFFHGSELIVCGRVGEHVSQEDFHYSVTGNSSEGTRKFEPEKTKVQFLQKPGFMERLWGYLTIQQLLEEESKLSGEEAAEKKRQAIQLALKFSFVTAVTSLVVVKPEDDLKSGNEATEVDLSDYDMLDDCSLVSTEMAFTKICLKKKRCNIQAEEPESLMRCMKNHRRKYLIATEEQQKQLPVYDKIFLSDFYTQTDETNTHTCIICSKEITEDSFGNMKNHVLTSHPEECKHSMLDFDFYNPDDSLISQQVTAAMNNTNISHFVKQKIPDKAFRVQYILQSKMKQHIQCLQLYVTKKQNNFFLIISIQSILSETQGVFTLATVEIQSGSSPDMLAKVVMRTLSDYAINKNQILFFITDSMAESSNTNENEQIEKITATLIEGVQSIGIPGGWTPKKLLNNSVYDAFKSIQPVISKLEEMKMPTVSDVKDWHSTYNILKNLLATKETSELGIGEEEWREIAQITDVLKSLEKLEEKQHTLSDFYGMWINCVEDIKKIGTPFAQTLSKCIYNKATTECPLFMAILFLNPKYKSLLDDRQVSSAIEQVMKIWQSITSSCGVGGLVGNKELQQLLKGYQNSVQEATEHTASQYWESQKDVQPILYKIASIALSAPLSESSIDQLLSNTNIFLSSLPDNIKQALITIRCLQSFLT